MTKRGRTRSTTNTWKWYQTTIHSKFKLTINRIMLLLLFLISMLTLGIKVGLMISRYSLVAHDNAILASYHNNNNHNNNNHNHNRNDVTQKMESSNEKQQHKQKHKGPTTNDYKNDVADIVVTTDADLDMDDHVRAEREEELVNQFVQWSDYPFLQELKEQIDDDTDLVEVPNENHHVVFNSFALKAKRTYTLLQEGMELLDTYHTLQAIDQNQNHRHGHGQGDGEGDTTGIDALLGEVDITEEMVVTILTKLKEIVTQALETTTSPENNNNATPHRKENYDTHENNFDIPAITDEDGEGADRKHSHHPPHRDPHRIPQKRTTTVKHQQEQIRRNRVVAATASESEGHPHQIPSDPDLNHNNQHQRGFIRHHENDEDFGELSSHYCNSTGSSNSKGHDDKGTNSSTTTGNTTKESTITTIILRGERHCGTKWIRSILEQNLRRSMYINQDDPKYGWKHGTYCSIKIDR